MMEGHLYRLGAWIAERCGEAEATARLSREYAEYRERYVDSFEALGVQALVGLWTEPERAAERAELLCGAEASTAGTPEWVGALGRKAAAWAGSLAELAPAPAGRSPGRRSSRSKATTGGSGPGSGGRPGTRSGSRRGMPA